MSVRVNLLPEEVQARGKESRARILAVVAGVVLLLVLAGLTFLQRSSISDAEDRLATVEEQNAELQADISALQPFADLDARAGTSIDLVALALAREASTAGILQDLSSVFPPNAQIDTIAITFSEDATAPSTGGSRVVFGQLTASGQVLDGVAPGVERLMIDIGRIASFDNVYVTTSTVDEDGIATFVVEAEFGAEVLTGRYESTTQEAAS